MRPATSLALMTVGAILAFAVRAHTSFLNFQVAGLVIIAVGVAGMLLPGRGSDWLRRRIVVRRRPGGQVIDHVDIDVDETRYPSYVMLNPEALHSVQPDGPPEEQSQESPPFIMKLPSDDLAAERSGAAEVVEEYTQE
jgi:hypothetical protein